MVTIVISFSTNEKISLLIKTNELYIYIYIIYLVVLRNEDCLWSLIAITRNLFIFFFNYPAFKY